MKVYKSPIPAKLAVVGAAVTSVVLLGAGPASASYNDDFSVSTVDGYNCGAADFIDYGDGLPGGGSNDDYIVIRDNCSDGRGVKAYSWITRQTPEGPRMTFLAGGSYNGNGAAGDPVIWDPFKDFNPDGNLVAGDVVAIKVCLVDGNDDSTASSCGLSSHTMQDG